MNEEAILTPTDDDEVAEVEIDEVEVVVEEEPPPPAPKLARLGSPPDWSELDPYQNTISKKEFQRLLDHCYVYSPEDYAGIIEIFPEYVRILKQANYPEAGYYELSFQSDKKHTEKVKRFWRAPWELTPISKGETAPLKGLHIALDPGHIGGDWAILEERHYQIGEGTIPVQEGDMNLIVANLLKKNLETLGAKVSLTRVVNEPVTTLRTLDLLEEAEAYLKLRSDFAPENQIQAMAERMFYRSSEIRVRAEKINEEIQPDFALCIHFNASPWADPNNLSFQDPNHLHILINGCYSRSEIMEDDTRLEMLIKLLQRTYYYELGLAEEISLTMERAMDLPAFVYTGKNAKRVNDNEFIYSRNLLANRTFECPVLFLEPYCMNNEIVHQRVQDGIFEGTKVYDGTPRKNIYQEYADSVTAGVVRYFRQER